MWELEVGTPRPLGTVMRQTASLPRMAPTPVPPFRTLRKPSGAGPSLSDWLRTHRHFLVVLAGYAVYVAFWSALTVTRFESHHALVYDLGLALEQMWLPVHAPPSALSSLFIFMNEGSTYVLSPVGLIGGYPAILVLQTLAIGGLSLPIYGIAARLLKDRTAAMILALSSLIFFVSGGANWYDFHFESFVPVVFLTAYWLLLAGHRKSSFGAFVAISFIRFPFGVFPFLYGALVVFEATVLRQDVDGMPRVLARKYGALLAVTCATLLAATLFLALPADLGTGQFSALLQYSQTTSAGGPAVSRYDELLTLVLPLTAMLFLPLFSRRWVVFLVPYTFLLVTTGFWAYSYPYAFSFQYVFTLVPFLYLGLIDASARVQWTRLGRGPTALFRRFRRFRRTANVRSIALVILGVMLVLGLFFEPYGPLNGATHFPYDTSANLATNETFLAEYHHLAQLIPPSDSNVLIQNNMPELFPRPLAGNEPLVPGVSLFANFTNSDAVNGSFPVWQFGKIVYIRFDYAIADEGSPQFVYGAPSMQDFVAGMYYSGAYGLLGEAGGMIVLEHNYSGPIEYYVPYSAHYPVESLFHWPSYAPVSSPVLTSTNTGGNTPLWNGPFVPLLPGSYRVTFTLETTNTSDGNAALVQVLGGSHAALLRQQNLTGADFVAHDTWEHYEVNFTALGPERDVQFVVRSLNWNGSLSVSGISLRQLAAPSPTFRAAASVRATAPSSRLELGPKGSTALLSPGHARGVFEGIVRLAPSTVRLSESHG